MEVEVAFNRSQSLQLSYSQAEADNSDDERTVSGASYIVFFGRRTTLLFYYGRVEDDATQLFIPGTVTSKSDEAQIAVRFAR